MGRFYNPVETHCGSNQLQELRSILASLKGRSDKVLLLTRGASFHGSEEEQLLLDQLKGKQVYAYDFIISNPDVKDLFKVMMETSSQDYDIVIAIGGGSVLDVAKSICAIRGMTINSAEELRTIITTKQYSSNMNKCSWIGIPTTAGTGSEVTSWATIWDNERNLKYSVEGKDLYAAAAIIDSNLTLNLPMRLTVSSALDAVCHATESYWSKRTNLLSRHYAVIAIRHIVQNIEQLIDDPKNPALREKIAIGSFLAGLAFSNTATTACHAISYPITLKFGVDHGVAVSMTLSKLLELNESYLVDKEALLEAFGVNNCKEVDGLIKRICKKADISTRLRDYGAQESELVDVVKSAFAGSGRMDNNPVDITEDILIGVLRSVY